MGMTKITPLYDWHIAHGAKTGEFAGYSMPLFYDGVLSEHQAVRERCGLFDISHMGEVYLEGPQALAFVQRLTSNDVRRLKDHEAQYSLLMNPKGFALDDILVYRLNPEKFLLCINASNIEKDVAWIRSQEIPGVEIKDASDETGMIALQGPLASQVLEKLKVDIKGVERFATREIQLGEISFLLSRTGYTGEEGYEFFVPWGQTLALWEKLFSAGEEYGTQPVGLGARDTLRLEMGYVLYGHELNETISPLEAGLNWVIDWEGEDFIGKAALLQQRDQGISRKLIGLVMEESGIPREGMALHAGDQVLGRVVSGTMSPNLKQGIATALVEKKLIPASGEIFVDIRGKMKKAKIAKPPFIQRS
jgi:aminomethyltransferase